MGLADDVRVYGEEVSALAEAAITAEETYYASDQNLWTSVLRAQNLPSFSPVVAYCSFAAVGPSVA